MKTIIFLSVFLTGLIGLSYCKPAKGTGHSDSSAISSDSCYQGVLVISGPCKQRVISVLSKNTGTLSLNADWKNSDDDKTYKKVFSVTNICDFPKEVKQGDTIYFKAIAPRKSECAVCLAYIPVPDSSNYIELCKIGK